MRVKLLHSLVDPAFREMVELRMRTVELAIRYVETKNGSHPHETLIGIANSMFDYVVDNMTAADEEKPSE